MKLLIAVINSEDVASVTWAMTKAGYPTTVADSFGGFYNRRNSVVFAGIGDSKVQSVLDIIAQNTHSVVENVPANINFGDVKLPSQVKISGAVISILSVDQFAKL